jgi:hypothetical protein
MKPSNTATPVSYLAVVTDLQQIKVHCPICLMQALGRAFVGGMVAKDTHLATMASVAMALNQALITLNLLEYQEIEAAHRLLLAALQSAGGKHTDDIPF